MKLKAVNNVLQYIGLVLVVEVDDGTGPTLLWIEKASKYDARTKK